jgi:hypothetical protein
LRRSSCASSGSEKRVGGMARVPDGSSGRRRRGSASHHVRQGSTGRPRRPGVGRGAPGQSVGARVHAARRIVRQHRPAAVVGPAARAVVQLDEMPTSGQRHGEPRRPPSTSGSASGKGGAAPQPAGERDLRRRARHDAGGLDGPPAPTLPRAPLRMPNDRLQGRPAARPCRHRPSGAGARPRGECPKPGTPWPPRGAHDLVSRRARRPRAAALPEPTPAPPRRA